MWTDNSFEGPPASKSSGLAFSLQSSSASDPPPFLLAGKGPHKKGGESQRERWENSLHESTKAFRVALDRWERGVGAGGAGKGRVINQ